MTAGERPGDEKSGTEPRPERKPGDRGTKNPERGRLGKESGDPRKRREASPRERERGSPEKKRGFPGKEGGDSRKRREASPGKRAGLP